MPQPWFRFYSEALRDRKLEYACRITSQPKVVIIGMWTTLLALANDSPDRGALLIADGFPVTIADIVRDTELPQDEVTTILEAFERLGMAGHLDDVLVVCNWDKRQFASDDVTSRVQKLRAKRKAKEDGNVTETLQGRAKEQTCNTPDTDTEQNKAEENTVAATAAPELPELPYDTPTNLDQWLELVKAPPPKTNRTAILRHMGETLYPDYETPPFARFGATAKKVGGGARLAQLMWKAQTGRVTGNYLDYCTKMASGLSGADKTTKQERSFQNLQEWGA